MAVANRKLYWWSRLTFLLGVAVLVFGVLYLGPLPSAKADSCGNVNVSGASWAGGAGVDSHSNYPDEGGINNDASCTNAYVTNLNASPPQEGWGWQCVELAQRMYDTHNWYGGGAFANVNGAVDIYTQASNLGFTTMAQGSIILANIVPGDMLVTHEATYGHVMVVDSVNTSNNTISAVDQNGADGGRTTVTYNPTAKTISDGTYYQFSGVVHSSNDSYTNGDNTVLEVKKISASDGTNEVIWSKATDVYESWWKGSSGINLGHILNINQGDIKSFDINLYSNGEHDLFTATTNNIWETWWFPGQGLHTSEILQNIGNISKIIKSVGPDGVTQQIYVLTNTGAYEYWWNSNSNGIQHGTIMTLANPVDEYKALEPNGTQALYVSDQTYPYELHWGPGINGIQQTTFTNFSGITSLSFSEDSDNKHRLYIGTSSGWIYEASWYPNGSIGYWTMTGGAPVVALQKWEDDSEQVLYEATTGGVFEYYWPTTSNSLSSDTIKGGLSSVHAFVRSTDPGGVQSVYTATGTNILESWWIPGGNGITTSQIEP